MIKFTRQKRGGAHGYGADSSRTTESAARERAKLAMLVIGLIVLAIVGSLEFGLFAVLRPIAPLIWGASPCVG